MSNIGRQYPSEMTTYTDTKTGRKITQLTSKYQNWHLYFTENSFTLGDEEIYFISSRPYDEIDRANFCKMDLKTGIITQITDTPGISSNGGYTKTPDSEYLVYISDNKLYTLNTITDEENMVYECEEGYVIGAPNISHDKKYIAIFKNEKIPTVFDGVNYSGFKETMYYVKRGEVVLVNVDGSGATTVFYDTHLVGHLQFAPDDSTLLSFCHEGPWNYIHQRIWLLNTVTREVWPCFRQTEEDDCVGHEFWTRDGYIFFDNRRKGHDGTITSDRTQSVTPAEATSDPNQIPYVGLANKKGEVIRKIELPYYCNHYHANEDNSLLVGDEVDDLVVIDLNNQPAAPVPICNHATSWRTAQSHVHPTWSWGSEKILFASDRGGNVNVYITDDWKI